MAIQCELGLLPQRFAQCGASYRRGYAFNWAFACEINCPLKMVGNQIGE